jgi:hypothetical protein
MKNDKPICEGCGKEVTDNVTYDFWVFMTVYDEDSEVVKTGGSVKELGSDYMVYGTCCTDKVRTAWHKFIDTTTTKS